MVRSPFPSVPAVTGQLLGWRSVFSYLQRDSSPTRNNLFSYDFGVNIRYLYSCSMVSGKQLRILPILKDGSMIAGADIDRVCS